MFWDSSATVPTLFVTARSRELARTGEPFVCLDNRLRDAAAREGFAILPA